MHVKRNHATSLERSNLTSNAGVGNLSLATGQKQTLQGLAGGTSYHPTNNYVPFTVYDLVKT